jgi:micrococcal nuclease
MDAAAAQVVRVIDGDTIVVSIGGLNQTARYIGVDTPETVHPTRPVKCYGPEASIRNKTLVEGQTVYLERDITETDRFGRLLRYI